MAIINSIAFGKSRKSAGNVVFYDRLGQTIARQKNLTPTNPNTYAQVARRILITNPSRMYRQIVDATSPVFGSKFFDFSFGRSYLATKRRTSYNEFFFRAMLRTNPIFLSKEEVQRRVYGVPDAYEIAQGSLTPVAIAPAPFPMTGKMEFVAASSTVSGDLTEILNSWLQENGYNLIPDFKCVIITQISVTDANGDHVPRTDAAIIRVDENGAAEFDDLGSAIVLTPGLGTVEVSLPSLIGGELLGFPMTFAMVPFGTVNGALTSANTSFVHRFNSTGREDYQLHSSDEDAKAAAIMSYSPSTPGL